MTADLADVGDVVEALALITNETWMEAGRCREVGPHLHFPEHGDSMSAIVAKRICNACEVRPQCLAYALDNEFHGIWGGYSRKERERVRKGQAVTRTPRPGIRECVECGSTDVKPRRMFCGRECRAKARRAQRR